MPAATTNEKTEFGSVYYSAASYPSYLKMQFMFIYGHTTSECKFDKKQHASCCVRLYLGTTLL